MRLLKHDEDGDFHFTRDLIEDEIPEYAILSHTWGNDEDEVTFKEIPLRPSIAKAGYKKIRLCGDQAKRDGLDHFWVDTCCIDRSDSTELQTAIVSMYEWYRKAAVCYVYLSDVSFRPENANCANDDNYVTRSWKPAFRKSRWFTRGWTLQELIAPDKVVFFSKEWQVLGSKTSLEQLIHEITSIPVLALRRESITHFSVAERLRWANGRQTKRKEDRAYCLLGIFKVFMPLIYGEGDNAMKRLTEEIENRERLHSFSDETARARANNSSREQSRQDPVHHSIPKPLTSAGKPTKRELEREELLNSLSFAQMSSRQSNIKRPYSKTCEWFLEHPTFVAWLSAESSSRQDRFLWIKGKPGAGKSTLMNFVSRNAIETKANDDIVICFFFNARGHDLERSTIGMYRAILFDLLQEVPELQYILDFFHSRSQHHSWTVETLNDLFSRVVTRLGRRRLQVFVDALDECDEEQVREMISSFEEICVAALKADVQMLICFASRPYPTISTDGNRTLILDQESGHDEDLVDYIENNLRTGKSNDADDIKVQIKTKANGIFMWAVIVVRLLNDEFRRGRIFAVQRRLEEIPSELSELFRDMLRKDTSNMDDLLLCIQLTLFARYPLTGEEFYCAMVSVLEPTWSCRWSDCRIEAEDIERFVSSSSKGLAELTKATPRTVQFIHESIRDYLLRDKGFAQLWSGMSADFEHLSHERLKQCCEAHLVLHRDAWRPPSQSSAWPESRMFMSFFSKYVSSVYDGDPLFHDFPFLKYASQCILYHANEAAATLDQSQFLVRYRSIWWSRVFKLLRVNPSLSAFLAEQKFTNLQIVDKVPSSEQTAPGTPTLQLLVDHHVS